jgi:two-component system response regulator RegA
MQPHSREAGQPEQLLLVDDDAAFCQVLARALERRGFEVFQAQGLGDAESLAARHQPRYAVIDLRIGPDSGLTLLQRLAYLSADTRSIVLTGYASIATAVEAIKLGAVHYLTKPTDADEIVTALQREEGDPGVLVEPQPLSVRRLEWEHLQKVLTEHDGNVSATARALRMHRRTLQRKLQKRPVRE